MSSMSTQLVNDVITDLKDIYYNYETSLKGIILQDHSDRCKKNNQKALNQKN